ncbi:MAG: aminotransferase class III-fold pyridoxal phosphate-dependent enzyme, partial [Phycisphaerae bacterium]|nr:aminotransferase class III-fold pyridoxal phosphate-dependent enzyme [Phycisphaerae bacterium]
MGKQEQLVAASKKVLIENYGRLDFAAARGKNARLWNVDGEEFIDFFPGFGAGGIAGHCHPRIVEAITIQAETLLSHGNLFTSAPQVDLAERITAHGFGGKVFYCQSGAEANEAALKLVRLAARGGERKADGPYKIISFHNCFHGRTMGALSITPPSFQTGFEPMLPGGQQVDFGDLAAVQSAIDEQTAGVFIEAIQVEGGLNVGSVAFLQGLRKLCDERGVLLVVDEVWTSPARTGKMFAINHYGIEPDAITLGKAIGGGLPVAAMVAHPKWADVLGPGTHGSTMGGNPICAAAGAAAMTLIEDENLCQRAATLGETVRTRLNDAELSCVTDTRGRGLLVGMELDESVAARDVMMTCMDRGL